jgi:hypothetical protein
MDIQNKRTIKKETPQEKEYWNKLAYIMTMVQGWAIIILWYVPIFTRMGISNKDIKNHFKEIIEAYMGEQKYCSKLFKRIK